MSKIKRSILSAQNELVEKLDNQLIESLSNSKLETVEALSVIMENIFSLLSQTESHFTEAKFTDSTKQNYKFTLSIEAPPASETQH